MRRMQALLPLVIVAACVALAEGRDYRFEGTWRTTNRPLDGSMVCVVTDGQSKVARPLLRRLAGRSFRLHGAFQRPAVTTSWNGIDRRRELHLGRSDP